MQRKNATDPIRVSMYEFPLSSCPNFTTLSYTWGNPTPVVDPSWNIFTNEPRCFPIICEDLVLLGTRNLRAALRQLRLMQNHFARGYRGDPNYSEFIENGNSPLGNMEYYWIDALCIDQEDFDEKSIQVPMMGTIYKQAELCIAWLGEGDSHTRLALRVSSEWGNSAELRSAYLDGYYPTKFRNLFGIRFAAAQDEEIISLAVLLSRTYFSRIWIFQEVILARKVMLICGAQNCNFLSILRMSAFLEKAEAARLISTRIRDDVSARLSLPKPFEAGSYTETPNTLTRLFHIREGLHRHHITPSFLETMMMTIKSHSTFLHDRIYGILAMTAEFQSESKLDSTLTVDYLSPIEQVYANATSFVTRRRNDLKVLSLVCDRTLKKIKPLPSWCPDYSTAETLIRDGEIATAQRHGELLWRSEPQILITNDLTLTVDAFCYETVLDVADVGNVTGFLKLVCSDRTKRSDTFVEELWRTLIMDRFATQTPAPAAVGLFLPAMLATMFSLQDKVTSEKRSEYSEVVANLHHMAHKWYTSILPDLDLLSSVTLDDKQDCIKYIEKEAVSSIERSVEAGLEAEFLKLLDDNIEGGGQRQSLEARVTALFSGTSLEDLETEGTSLFITKSFGRFGKGLTSIKAGDEIWALNGNVAPAILRPLANGNHEFVGNAYIFNDPLYEEMRPGW
ncbi:heterokaryon incompatibility protein-domain-containing protein [Xylogone sp. PMI_703]|nr:heterokaryon incompatibility protein-domain-containing protein [Xylogone sp. PMI_703]